MLERWITDWTINPRFPLFTRANAGEVLPSPASPLAWGLVWEPGILPGWRDSAVLDYQSVDPDELDVDRPEVIGSFGGYLYINATSVRLFGVRGPGLTPEAIDAVYLGAHPDAPPYEPEPWHENPAATERVGRWMAGVVGAQDLTELRDDRELANSIRDARPNLSTLTDGELVERARSLIPHIRHLFRRHLAVTAGSSIGPGILAAIAEAMGDPSIALKLITAVGDIDSAAPSHAMWELSRRPADSAEYRDGFGHFLRNFGSRGPNEWDIRSATWETDPNLVTVLINAMRAASDADAPAVRNSRNEQMREDLTASIRSALAEQPEVLEQFEAGLRSAHLHLAGRERAKTNVIKVIHEVRLAIWELAARHDYTSSTMCMLLGDELDAFVNDPDEFRARLASREQQYLELFELEPPFIINGAVKPLTEWTRRDSAVAAIPVVIGDVLSGVPGAPGVATGRARVVLHPSDPMGLEPGDVLVAPLTDPAWTPLFVPACAVVVDVGAQVSHAVIVSRELGIPCAVSVQDATRRIPDGALISVDGSAGTVTILDLGPD